MAKALHLAIFYNMLLMPFIDPAWSSLLIACNVPDWDLLLALSMVLEMGNRTWLYNHIKQRDRFVKAGSGAYFLRVTLLPPANAP